MTDIPVALVCYTTGPEQVFRTRMPAVPQVGQTIHWSTTGDPGDSRAWHVFNVSWVYEPVNAGIANWSMWHLEVALR